MIKKVIENRNQAKIQKESGDEVLRTEEIVGSLSIVKDFATFYANHEVDLETVRVSMLMDYCETQSFTPEQLTAYRQGQDSIVRFFESSDADIKSYILQQKEKQRGSVG
jgi:hypothetical protein